MILEPGLRAQLIAAVLITQGRDKIITQIELQPSPHPGIRCFLVESCHVIRGGRKCMHLDTVYLCEDRLFVVTMIDRIAGISDDVIISSLQEAIR
jgi:hypothetical protein